jgi:predicted P-loop ATPase
MRGRLFGAALCYFGKRQMAFSYAHYDKRLGDQQQDVMFCPNCEADTLIATRHSADKICLLCESCAYRDYLDKPRDDFPGGERAYARPNGHDETSNAEPLEKANRVATASAIAKELRTNPALRGAYGLNVFSRKLFLMRAIPSKGRQAKTFRPRPLRDSDITTLVCYLEDRGFRKVFKNTVKDVMHLAAEEGEIFPLRDRLGGLVWDGVERLDRFFIDHAGVCPPPDLADTEAVADWDEQLRYVCAVSRCFFISAVARVFRPGCKVDTCLVLEGPQGVLKSSLLRTMALDDDYFSDSMPQDLSSKDAREHLCGKFIIELGEVVHLRRSRVEATKMFLSCQTDKFRPSYGHFEIDWPRINVFAASTNEDTYFADDTGNRRFWPILCGKIDLEGAKAVIEQVWAEAVTAFKADEPWWLSDDIEAIARREQADRKEPDPWEDFFAQHVDAAMSEYVTTEQALGWLGLEREKQTKPVLMRAGAVLRSVGCTRKRIRPAPGEKRQYGYFKPAKQDGCK